MAKIDVLNTQGEKVSQIDLNDNVFNVEVNESAMHAAVINYMANQRQGTQSTKTRAEVRGGGRKPWKQKGTGRARQGSIRAPHWVKGGVALGPKPRSFKYTLTKKLKRVALKSAFTTKVLTNNMIVLDSLNFNEIKTKNMVNVLNNLKVNTKTLIVLSEKNENVQKSARNLVNVKTTLVNTLNTYDVLKFEKFIVTKDAIAKIEEVYA